MINASFSDPNFAPFAIIVPALIMIALLALTMRAVIMRERAMIRARRGDSAAQSSYEQRWRNRSAA